MKPIVTSFFITYLSTYIYLYIYIGKIDIYIYIHIYIYIYTYAIMKTMCPPVYHHNGFVAAHALGHMMNRTSCAQVHGLPQSHCSDNEEGTLFS